MIDYAGRRALVTGAASGIGRALSLALADRGARLVLVDVNAQGMAATAAQTGAETLAIVAYLSDPAEPARVVAKAFEDAGRIDLICSNAGVAHGRRLIREALDDQGRRLFELNLFAGLRLAQAYAQALEATGGRGRIIFTGSEHSLSLPPTTTKMGLGLYNATKHALLAFAEWMRLEFAGRTPIDVHILLPGPISTTLSDTVPRELLDSPLDFITAARCAELALKGMDLDLFYIPTHAHIAEDMRPRLGAVQASVRALGLS